jgi:hypothetical protein
MMDADTRGWRMEAPGKLGAGDARLRGSLVVKSLSTTNDPYTEGGFYIESNLSEEGVLGADNTIYFLHPELDPPWPAQLGTVYYPYNEDFPDTPESQHLYMHTWLGDDSEGLGTPKFFLTVENPSGEEAHPYRTYARLTAEEIQVNGITIVKPPLRVLTGNDTSVPDGDETTLDISTSLMSNTSIDGDVYIGFDDASNVVRPLIPGWYTVEATIAAEGPDEFYAYYGINIGPLTPVDDGDTTILSASSYRGGALGTTDIIRGTFEFDGVDDYLRIRALQGSGSSQDIRIIRLELRYASLP